MTQIFRPVKSPPVLSVCVEYSPRERVGNINAQLGRYEFLGGSQRKSSPGAVQIQMNGWSNSFVCTNIYAPEMMSFATP